MSKNHPHDNIYSILGKLAALQPTAQEKHAATVKQIQESVEAQGSIIKGLREISSTESRLAQQFAESKIEEKAVSQAQQKFMGMVHAAQKGSKAASPAVAKVAKDMGKKDARDFAATKHAGLPQHVAEETCNECGMYESKCSCDHTNEGKVTHPEKGVTRHTKTDFPGYPSDDLEKDDDDKDAPKAKGGKGRPRKATTKNPRRDADAPKKSRGRPSKHSTGEKSSSDSLPFSSKNKVGHDLFGRVKSSAHKTVTESVNFKRMLDEQHMTLEEMIACMQEDMLQFKKTGVCSERLRDMMEVYAHAKKQMEETQGGIGHDLITPQQRVAQATPPKPGIVGAVKDVAKGASNWLRGKPEQGPTYEEVDTMEAELNELAKLAGLDEVSRGEYIKQQDDKAEHSGKKEFNAFGQLFHTDEVDEGNVVTKGLSDQSIKIGDKIPGTDLTKTKQIEMDEAYGDAEVDVAKEKPANAPKKKYFSMKGSTMNPGEGDSGEKRMYPAHPAGDNGMTEPARRTPVKEDVLSLEAQLAAEYESIKKAS